MMTSASLSEHAWLDTAWVMMQVTRDKLLQDHLYKEKVDISRETGSGYPAGTQCMTSFCQHMCCTPDFGCSVAQALDGSSQSLRSWS